MFGEMVGYKISFYYITPKPHRFAILLLARSPWEHSHSKFIIANNSLSPSPLQRFYHMLVIVISMTTLFTGPSSFMIGADAIFDHVHDCYHSPDISAVAINKVISDETLPK